MIPEMKFAYLSWEAFATMITGALAVYAAWRVGLRQVEIQGRQAKIQERLAAIEERKLRSDLFDRRIAVYEAASKWFAYFLTTGQVAGRPTRAQKTMNMVSDKPRAIPGMEVSIAYLDAMLMSRFLFQPHVERALKAAWDASERWSETARREGEGYNDEKQRQALLAETRKEIILIYDSLVDIFAPELQLGDLAE